MPAPKLAAYLPQHAEHETAEAEDARHPVALLASLHREAEETARLANLLGRSIHVAIALPILAAATLALGGVGLAESAAWMVFVLAASGAIGFCYRRTIAAPFERAALKSFSRDLSAILAFGGFAWGAGAFLALPASTGIGAAVLFAAGAGMAVAVLLRERESAFLFLAPVAALASFACVLRPLDAGALGAAFILIACAAVAACAAAAGSWRAEERGSAMAGLPLA
ncbi:MAG TPA: hypothetical protein VHZ29_07255 [Rhizomicrobium sp.]|jgi:hypothetical protein|nr:hypothetical protein [Rhizomicrobium sp.]